MHTFSRTFWQSTSVEKPFGYPGDYEVMRFLYELPFEGPTLFAKMMSLVTDEMAASRAVRSRKDLVKRWLKARLQNRRGAPCWQPYLELRKLFAKEVVVSDNASWLFRVAPFIVFASTVAVTFLAPILAVPLDREGLDGTRLGRAVRRCRPAFRHAGRYPIRGR